MVHHDVARQLPTDRPVSLRVQADHVPFVLDPETTGGWPDDTNGAVLLGPHIRLPSRHETHSSRRRWTNTGVSLKRTAEGVAKSHSDGHCA